MTEVSAPVAAVITCRDDLVEILRARKAELGLSNSYVEHQLQMGDGNADKFIGPMPTKGMSLSVVLDMVELLGGRLVFEVCPETEARMRKRWEGRDEKRVHPPKRRLSKKLMELAKPLLFAELGRVGGRRRVECQTASQRSESARTAAHSRWRLHRAAMKARAIAEASP